MAGMLESRSSIGPVSSAIAMPSDEDARDASIETRLEGDRAAARDGGHAERGEDPAAIEEQLRGLAVAAGDRSAARRRIELSGEEHRAVVRDPDLAEEHRVGTVEILDRSRLRCRRRDDGGPPGIEIGAERDRAARVDRRGREERVGSRAVEDPDELVGARGRRDARARLAAALEKEPAKRRHGVPPVDERRAGDGSDRASISGPGEPPRRARLAWSNPQRAYYAPAASGRRSEPCRETPPS